MANSRQQLPPQTKKAEVFDRTTGKTVVRYQVRVDAGVDRVTGTRRQVRRRFKIEREAREELGKVSDQAAIETFVPRKAVTLEDMCAD